MRMLRLLNCLFSIILNYIFHGIYFAVEGAGAYGPSSLIAVQLEVCKLGGLFCEQ